MPTGREVFQKFQEESERNYTNFIKFAEGDSDILFLCDLEPNEKYPETVPYKVYRVGRDYLTEEEQKRSNFDKKYAWVEGDTLDPRYIQQKADEGKQANPKFFGWSMVVYLFNITAYEAVIKNRKGQRLSKEEKQYVQQYSGDENFNGIFVYELHAKVRDRIASYLSEEASEGRTPSLLTHAWRISRDGLKQDSTYMARPGAERDTLPEGLLNTVDELFENASLEPLSDIVDRMRFKGLPDEIPEEASFKDMPGAATGTSGGTASTETPEASEEGEEPEIGPSGIDWGSPQASEDAVSSR